MKTNLWKSLEFLIEGFSWTYFQVCVGIIVTSLNEHFVIYTQGYYYQYKCEKSWSHRLPNLPHFEECSQGVCIGSLQGKDIGIHLETKTNPKP